MDPKQLFFDDRFRSVCVYCGMRANTRDHVPSKVLLDLPYPANLPVVAACERCNNEFSKDEPYLACLIDCVIRGAVQPDGRGREKIARMLCEKPHLVTEMNRARLDDLFGVPQWQPDFGRVMPIVLKLARGHAAFEFAEPKLYEPRHVWVAPLETLTAKQRNRFESVEEHDGTAGWPEIGSRAFHRMCVMGDEVYSDEDWSILQHERYRYLTPNEETVRFVLSEYLGCEVVW